MLIVERGGTAFQTVPLPGDLWLACLGLGATTLLVRAGVVLLVLGQQPQTDGEPSRMVQQPVD